MSIHPSVLKLFPLLRVLSASVLDQVAQVSSLRTYARREIILEKGSAPNGLLLVHEGQVQATDFTLDGKEVCLYHINEQGYFGEVSLLDGQGQPEVMVAAKKTALVHVPQSAAQLAIEQEPALLIELAKGLATRLRLQGTQRQILSINTPLQRVCAQLLLLHESERLSHNAALDASIHAPTHQDIALLANLSRETVTRVFQALQSQSVVQREGDRLLLQVARLREMATQA